MASTLAGNGRADQIYTFGPEEIVATTPVIVAGVVSGYKKDVLKYSQPGPDGFPLQWLVKGSVDRPESIKGDPVTGPISFSRPEQSFFVPVDPEAPAWERDFGDVSPNGEVVLFLSGERPPQVLNVVPNGTQEQDFVALVKTIVRIQGREDLSQRREGWLHMLTEARSDEARRVALRSLMRADVDWPIVSQPLKNLFPDPALDSNIKIFAFGLVAFYVTQHKWASDVNIPVDFLCRIFTHQREPRLEIQYLQSLKLILAYAAANPQDESLRQVRAIVLKAVDERAALSGGDPALSDQYKRIKAQYGTP